ncbi:RHS repeat domain-containing protein [Microbulbifer sp. CnH-101-E]|uniref:RHS repeat domain-containing protein n=1 Tax=unclassified Microbulbifer TaxID=2619833 RepID=UPI004039E3A9
MQLPSKNPAPNVENHTYDAIGNLLRKDDFASSYSYTGGSSGGPSAVKSVSLINGGTKTYGYDKNGNRTHENGAQQIWYNAFNKPTRINRNGANLYFYYGADQMRYKQVNQTSGKTTLYIDKLFEKITGGGETQYRHFIGDIAVLTTTDNGSETTHKIGFSHRDRLGSAAAVADEAGNLKESHSFDPFGKPRQGNILDKDTAILESEYSTRGFTDHEHLDDVELIHMNGRAYDYNLGRFLSVDPIIQSPGNSQSLNPYSYIMNNPLAGTDPSGYVCAASLLEGVCGSLPSHWGGNGGGRAKKRSDGFNHAKFENPLNGAVTAVLEGVGLQSTDIGSQASRENLEGDQGATDSGQSGEGTGNPGFLDKINPFSEYNLKEKHAELTASCAAQSLSGNCNGTSITPEIADNFSNLTGGTIGAVSVGQTVAITTEQIAIRVATSVAKSLGSFADEAKLIRSCFIT